MHPNNFTLYQLIKYHIELTEAMEYTLITYKYDEGELIERFNFLNNDYKKGFYHYITKKLFKKSKKITKEINDFIATYNRHNIPKMVDDRNLHSRIKYNQKLYLAYSCSNNLIQVFLDEENIKNLVCALMEANGYSAVSAGSCADGDMLYFSHRPDVVILDLGLPDADGIELLKKIRKSSLTPVIVLSARNQAKLRLYPL